MVVASGCVNETLKDTSTSAAALLKVNNKPDKFSLKKAQRQNQAAADFADSKEDVMEGDSFIIYVEAAKIADEASRPLIPLSSSSGVNSGILNAAAAAGAAAASQLQSSIGGLFSGMGTLSSSAVSSTGTFNVGGQTTPATSSGGGSTTSTPAPAPAAPAPAPDPDYQTLMSYYDNFQNYQTLVDPIISQATADPWSARDIVIDDQTLVSLLSSSHAIFDFIRLHPSVNGGDEVLASVGDTLLVINDLWGLGRNEAQTAYLMINIYYPNGGYVSHAQEGLSFL